MSEHTETSAGSGDPKTPLSLKLISAFCALFMIVTGGIIIFVPYTRSERVQGIVESEPGVVKLYSELNSKIAAVYVSEGETVKKGQALMSVSTERQLDSGGSAQLALGKQSEQKKATLRQEMENIRALYDTEQNLISSQIARKQAEVSQIKANIDIQERVYALAKDNYKRRFELVDKGFITKEGLAEVERSLLLAQGAYESAKKDLISAQAAMDELEANKNMVMRRREKELYPLSRELSSVNQESIDIRSRQEFVITASSDGIVATVIPKAGDTVLEKDLLISISPMNAKFLVSLYVPSSAIGFLEKKNPVLLRYETYPYQKFGEYGATVRSISPVALDRNDLKLPALSPDSYYRVQVEPDQQKVHAYGRDFALHDGIKVEADIKVETRKVFEWILEPVYAKFYGK